MHLLQKEAESDADKNRIRTLEQELSQMKNAIEALQHKNNGLSQDLERLLSKRSELDKVRIYCLLMKLKLALVSRIPEG